ncbi:MAG TPA: hypothetical protein VK611_08680 [Acidimicrobiales bacterium]|nr:hypothetical protein [Acidimicrobiales bacterium]
MPTEKRVPDDDLVLECRVYTHARRHPIIIGNIQGLRIPPVTPAQLLVGVGALVVLVATQPLWAHFGSVINGLAMITIPLGLAFAARALRVEGRAPWRYALGWFNMVAAPKGGKRLGKADRTWTMPRHYTQRTWVAELTTPGER